MNSFIGKIFNVFNKVKSVLNAEQKRYGILVAFLGLAGALLEVVGVSAILPLVQAFMDTKSLLEKGWIQPVIKTFNITASSKLIVILTGLVIVLFLVKNIFFIFLSWLRITYSCKISRELSASVMEAYMEKGYEFFTMTNTAELSRNISADTSGVETILSQLLKMFTDICTISLIVAYILVTDLQMAVTVIILAAVCIGLIYGVFRKKMKTAGDTFFYYHKLAGKYLLESLQGIKEVLAMSKQKYFIRYFNEANIKKNKASIKQTVGTEAPAYIIEAICVAGLLLVVSYKIITTGGSTSEFIPTLSAFTVGAFRILPSLGRISAEVNTIIYYMPSLNRVHDNLNNLSETTKYSENSSGEGKNFIKAFKREILIKDLSWAYGGSHNNIINNLNMSIKKGESVAFIGLSGAGKTTLADILLGLLHPQNGEITIDDMKITENTDLSGIMSYVPQSVYLLDESVRLNVAFGLKNEEIDDELVWAALEKAQIKDFVENLSEGINTLVGDRGIRFSGGQRQRIAIARALYNNPEIIIFDEATAALDGETESAVMNSIHSLKGEKTLIIVAHRMSTIKECDTIYEIKNGKAYKISFEEIMEREGSL